MRVRNLIAAGMVGVAALLGVALWSLSRTQPAPADVEVAPVEEVTVLRARTNVVVRDDAPQRAVATPNDTIEADASGETTAPVGPIEWMAEVSEEDEQRVEAAFERVRAQQDRKSAIAQETAANVESTAVATLEVEQCFSELLARDPTASGRVAVAWDVAIDGESAAIVAPRVTLNYRMPDPEFARCIVARLDSLTVPLGAAPTPARYTVERPFFFDGH